MRAFILGFSLWASSAVSGADFDAQVLFLGEVHGYAVLLRGTPGPSSA